MYLTVGIWFAPVLVVRPGIGIVGKSIVGDLKVFAWVPGHIDQGTQVLVDSIDVKLPAVHEGQSTKLTLRKVEPNIFEVVPFGVRAGYRVFGVHACTVVCVGW